MQTLAYTIRNDGVAAFESWNKNIAMENKKLGSTLNRTYI